MSLIIVTPLSELEPTIRRDRPSHIVTLLSPEHMIETPPDFAADHHLRLSINDVADVWAGEAPPAAEHVQQLIDFGRGWTAQFPLLVHCWAGISRSTAAAYILLCDRHEAGLEGAIARALRVRAPHACPNTLMIRLADELLGRNGRMIDAVQSIGRGTIAAIGERIELPITMSEL